MADVILQHMTNGQNISAANSNFDKIQDNINNHSIQSDSGNNVMYQDFDLNNHNLLNVPVTTNQNGVVRRSELTAETAARVAGDASLQTQLDNINAPGGSFIQAGTDAVSRTWSSKVREQLSFNDFRLPTDTDTQVFQKAVNDAVALFGEATVILPNGTFNITNASVPAGIWVEGSGKTYIQSAGNNPIFTLFGNNVISKIKFKGVGSGTLDRGITSSGVNNIEVFECSFTNFRKEPIRIANGNNADIHHCHFYSNYGDDTGIVTTSAEPEIIFVDNCNGIRACNNRFFADPTRPKQIAIFPSAQTAGAAWTNGLFNDNYINGYCRGGIYPDDENPINGIKTAYGTISGNTIVGSGQEAIKVKNVQRLAVTNNIINGYELISVENASSLLQGGIFMNNAAGSTVVGNTIYGSGAACTDGIHVSGSVLSAWAYTDTFSRWGCTVANNTLMNCGKYAIRADQASQLTVTGNIALNCGGFIGCIFDPTNPTRYNNNVTVTGNSYRGGTFAGATGALYGAYFYSVKNLVFDNNILNDCAGTGLFIQSCTDAKVGNSLVYNAATISGGGPYGIQLTDSTNVLLTGVTSSCREGLTTQQYGLRLTGTLVGISMVDCDLTGNAVGAVTGLTFPSDSLVVDNRGYLASTISWTPGTVANAAQVNQGISVTGAAPGDFVDVCAPYDLLGATVTAYVTAANSARIVVTNNSGASITLATGVWKVRVSKKP